VFLAVGQALFVIQKRRGLGTNFRDTPHFSR
jgi:hypothetical protein